MVVRAVYSVFDVVPLEDDLWVGGWRSNRTFPPGSEARLKTTRFADLPWLDPWAQAESPHKQRMKN